MAEKADKDLGDEASEFIWVDPLDTITQITVALYNLDSCENIKDEDKGKFSSDCMKVLYQCNKMLLELLKEQNKGFFEK